jgi:hypothetical protein
MRDGGNKESRKRTGRIMEEERRNKTEERTM